MDKKLKEVLDTLKIKFISHKHEPIFTVAQADKIMKENSYFLHTKNLFLKDESKRFFLVCIPALKKVDLKKLKEKTHAKKKITFASASELKEHLNVSPGSVSIFSAIYAKNIALLLDKDIWDARMVGFHPNDNSSTLEISHADLEKFFNFLEIEKEVIEIDEK